MHRTQSIRPWRSLAAMSLMAGIIGVAGCTIAFSGNQPVVAQEQRLNTLTVSGEGTINIPTSLTQVNLGVEVQGKTAEQVQQEVARRSSGVVEFLRSRNVEKLETTGIRLSPNYNYTNGERRLIGYVGTNTVSFRVETENAGDLLDRAVEAGATRIDGISFVATDEAIDRARTQALRAATQDAQTQADAVLETLNLSRQEIVSIQINSSQTPPPRPYQARAEMAPASSDRTPVIGGEQEVKASVTLEIRY